MQLNVIRADDSITHLAIQGRLDIEGVNQIQDRFVFQTAARHKTTLVDLSEVTFIASLGMGMLIGAAKALQRHGARMILIAPRELVQHALETAGIHRVIPIVRAEDDALQLLR
jgi:anti-anti-sigma factor